MKKLLPILLAISLPTLADVQINQDEEFIHVPYDPGNTDNELFIGSIPKNVVSQENATQRAYVSFAITTLCPNLPYEIRSLEKGERIHLIWYNLDGEQCTITDVNGDSRQVNKWDTQIKMLRPVRSDRDATCKLRVTVICVE